MSKKIYKYPLEIVDTQIVKMSLEQILTVQIQNGVPCLWAIIDEDINCYIPVKIHTFGTGQEFSDLNLAYIGTYQYGALVFHVFYEPLK